MQSKQSRKQTHKQNNFYPGRTVTCIVAIMVELCLDILQYCTAGDQKRKVTNEA